MADASLDKTVDRAERDARAARAKAVWRDESLRRHLDRPIADRLRDALALILPRPRRDAP